MLSFNHQILSENEKRNKLLFQEYDPIRGIGSPIERIEVSLGSYGKFLLPAAMNELPVIKRAIRSKNLYQHLSDIKKTALMPEIFDTIMRLRLQYDFEFWAATCAKIYSKPTEDNEESELIPFVLRLAQRLLLGELEKMRLAKMPIRIIVDKARQWGGSTLIQLYCDWIGLFHRPNWNMAVVAQDDNAAKNIRQMFLTVSENYPSDISTVTLVPDAKSTKNLKCVETGGKFAVGSIENPKQFRSYSYMMAHLSEVAFWGDTAYKNALHLAQSIKASIPRVECSVVAIESTAKGVGNFFHNEWIAAKEGTSGYVPIFIPWWTIDMYWKPIKQAWWGDGKLLSKAEAYKLWFETLANGFKKPEIKDSVVKYAEFLWSIGVSIESINWYFYYKQTENASDQYMFEEFPSTADESFVSSGRRAFDQAYVNNIRKYCQEPSYLADVEADGSYGKAALANVRIKQVSGGLLKIWQEPDYTINMSNRYLVVVDIGGRHKKADWSVITVFDRYWMKDSEKGGGEVIVAEWAGHLDQDLVAWKAAQIASVYGNALLVVERNSLKVKNVESEGDHSITVLDLISEFYNNLYARNEVDRIKENLPPKWGFFTGSNKALIVDALNAAMRDDNYEEMENQACNEMDTYEIKLDGTYGARQGCHDDKVMTRAIGIHISRSYMPLPREIVKSTGTKSKTISEASF